MSARNPVVAVVTFFPWTVAGLTVWVLRLTGDRAKRPVNQGLETLKAMGEGLRGL